MTYQTMQKSACSELHALILEQIQQNNTK